MDKRKTLIVLAGPTAVGKTHAAIELAKKMNCEVLNADSRQFYREMRIGTARPDADQLQGVPHHLLGHISIQQTYSAGDFAREAQQTLSTIFQHSDRAIVVGGSGLYLQALLQGLDSMPPVSDLYREQLNELYRQQGMAPLLAMLQVHDPTYLHLVDQQNPQRVIRALEVCLASGQPYSSFRQSHKTMLPYHVLYIALDMPREALYERIHSRVDQMLMDGLEEEARKLYPSRDLNALKTVGYREFFDYFEDTLSYEECVTKIKQHTRNYAKKQWTWLRKRTEYTWFEANASELLYDWIQSHA